MASSIKSVINQYLGINAHLHSLWQATTGWQGFHATHITYLAELLKEMLGKDYRVEVESSLQIRSENALIFPRSDVSIFDKLPQRAQLPTYGKAELSGVVVPILQIQPEIQLEDEPLPSLIISDRKTGKHVAWIELLSPSNKQRTALRDLYIGKRLEILNQGLVYVEIDYIHETPSTYQALTNPRLPYRILVFDPRPTPQTGRVSVNEFGVDDAIPSVTIPLSGDDAVHFPFSKVYLTHFLRQYLGDDVDYTQLPLNFEHYTPQDQQRIVSRMLAVIQAHQAGKDLEVTPTEIPLLPLEDALAQLQSWQI
jgi:hypothetical protein